MTERRVHVIDLDNVLHVGAKAGHSKDYNIDGVPTGGIYYLLSTLRKSGWIDNPQGNPVVVVYDTHRNYRKEIATYYKAHRKNKSNVELIRDKGVWLQKDIAVNVLNKCGVLTLGMEGLEADDLMFNLALNLACHPSQPLLNGIQLRLHTSDEDWVGAMGLAPNIVIDPTVKASTLHQKRTYNDYQRNTGKSVEDCYMERALYGDNSDGYKGFGDTFRDTLGRSTSEIYGLPEVQQYFYQKYWDRTFWIALYNKYYASNPELLKEMVNQTNLAFPVFLQEVFETDLLRYCESTPTFTPLAQLLNVLRIRVLEKNLGPLHPFNENHKQQINSLKSKYSGEYGEVFELYSSNKVRYLPEVKITIEEVNKSFQVTNSN